MLHVSSLIRGPESADIDLLQGLSFSVSVGIQRGSGIKRGCGVSVGVEIERAFGIERGCGVWCLVWG